MDVLYITYIYYLCIWAVSRLRNVTESQHVTRRSSSSSDSESLQLIVFVVPDSPNLLPAMTAVSPFARSSAFEDSLSAGREQTVSHRLVHLTSCAIEHEQASLQIEEMYSVPESFLEIEVRNPQTHGELEYL